MERGEARRGSGSDHRAFTGGGVLAAAWLVAGALLGTGLYLRHPLLVAQAVLGLLFAGVLVAVRRALGDRGAGREALLRAQGVLLTLLGSLGVTLSLVGLLAPYPAQVLPAAWGWGTLGGELLLLLGAAVLAWYYATTPAEELPEAPALAAWLRLLGWVALLVGAALLASLLGKGSPGWPARSLFGLDGLLALELFVAGLAAWRGAEAPPEEEEGEEVPEPASRLPLAAPVGGWLLRCCFARANPVASFFAALERAFGVEVKSSWALSFSRRALLPLALTLAALYWLSTGVAVLQPWELGVRERFGRPVSTEPLGPGLHVGWPWPVDRVLKVSATRIRSIPIGFEGPRTGASMLWTKQHAAQEFNLLLGNGRDLVTVNAHLHYRVKDVFDYLYTCQDPEAALQDVTYWVLTRHTLGRTLDDVLSENVAVMTRELRDAVQREADARRLGIEVVGFSIQGLHPPVAVATDYQDVVSAQVDRETRIVKARAYRMETLPAAEAEAVRIVKQAEADKALRVAQATGEAESFRAVEASYEAAPSLFRFRRRLEVLEKVLPDKTLYVVDRRIERDGGNLWFLE